MEARYLAHDREAACESLQDRLHTSTVDAHAAQTHLAALLAQVSLQSQRQRGATLVVAPVSKEVETLPANVPVRGKLQKQARILILMFHMKLLRALGIAHLIPAS
jgi:hypothetical protein